MSIINKISDTEYEVGKYRIIERISGDWTLLEDDIYIAVYYDKHTALAWANLNYTCGHMVSEGVRELLKLVIKEEQE
jgi:hypothetical protein